MRAGKNTCLLVSTLLETTTGGFGVVWRGGEPKAFIFCDENVETMSDALRTLRDTMCSSETSLGVAGAKVVPSGFI